MDTLDRLVDWLNPEAPTLADDGATAEGGLAEEDAARMVQHFSVFLEYERLQDIIPSGMYVAPAFDDPFAWHGVLFVRRGFYQGGVFRFLLMFPEDYPASPPTLTFTSPVFHPMVDPGTGAFDMSGVFPEWRAGRDYASFALPFLHRAMLRREYLSGTSWGPLNKEARALFADNPSEFAARTAECARQSALHLLDSRPDCPLRFAKGLAEAGDDMLRLLRAAEGAHDSDDVGRKEEFVSSWCEMYSPTDNTCTKEADMVEDMERCEANAGVESNGAPGQ